MKTLYLDCGMGAAGDMLTAALLELFPHPEEMVERLNALGIPGAAYILRKSEKCGITGSHIRVEINGVSEGEHEEDHAHHHEHEEAHAHHHGHDHHHHGHEEGEQSHHHHSLGDIRHIVKDHLRLTDKVKEDVLSVFNMIAEAESHVHGKPVDDIHFHEVGTMDAVADVTAVCYLLNELKVDEVVASPVHVGYGKVKCAHGILPVPAPATAYILKDVPIYGGYIEGELCTPTGAALLKYFVSRFGVMQVMKTRAIGYGMGNKDFQAANCIRAMLGESDDLTDTVAELSCNVDDMTAEEMGYAVEKLFEGGALEVYTVAVGMKKGRPGCLLRVICPPADRERMAELIFKHTSTIGIRQNSYERYVLKRESVRIDTPCGSVSKKISTGYGARREKYEFDDLSKIADGKDMSIREVRDLLSSYDRAE